MVNLGQKGPPSSAIYSTSTNTRTIPSWCTECNVQYLSQQLGVSEVGDGLHDGSGALLRVAGLEDTRAHKHTIHAYTMFKYISISYVHTLANMYISVQIGTEAYLFPKCMFTQCKTINHTSLKRLQTKKQSYLAAS